MKSRRNKTNKRPRASVLAPANVVQTCQRKRLPLVARPAVAPHVLSNTYRALPLPAVPLGGFEPRRPRDWSRLVLKGRIVEGLVTPVCSQRAAMPAHDVAYGCRWLWAMLWNQRFAALCHRVPRGVPGSNPGCGGRAR